MAPLVGMNLNPLQMMAVGGGLLLTSRLSVFAILTREFNVRTAVTIAAGTTLTALFVGGVMNHLILFIQSIF